MNIKLLLRIYAGLMTVFTLGALFSAESMMESFGMSYTTEAGIILQFAMLGQVIFIVLTLQIINWLGDDVHKVGTTYNGTRAIKRFWSKKINTKYPTPSVDDLIDHKGDSSITGKPTKTDKKKGGKSGEALKVCTLTIFSSTLWLVIDEVVEALIS